MLCSDCLHKCSIKGLSDPVEDAMLLFCPFNCFYLDQLSKGQKKQDKDSLFIFALCIDHTCTEKNTLYVLQTKGEKTLYKGLNKNN